VALGTVIGAIARYGHDRRESPPVCGIGILDGFVREVVDKDQVGLVATDEYLGYRMLSRGDAALRTKLSATALESQ
jgi:hypothetical protein